MTSKDGLEHILVQAARQAPERAKYADLAAKKERQALRVLLAFSLEVEQIPHRVKEPTLGLIRLQWWRDVLQGGEEGAPLAAALRAVVREHDLSRTHFDAYFDAWAEALSQPEARLSAANAYGALEVLNAEVLGIREARPVEAARALGAAWARLDSFLTTPQEELRLDTARAAEADLGRVAAALGDRFPKGSAPVFLKATAVRGVIARLKDGAPNSRREEWRKAQSFIKTLAATLRRSL